MKLKSVEGCFLERNGCVLNLKVTILYLILLWNRIMLSFVCVCLGYGFKWIYSKYSMYINWKFSVFVGLLHISSTS